MEITEMIPHNKVAIVDVDYYEKIKELSEFNEQEIDHRSKELFNNYIKDVGIDIKIKYRTDKNILYNNLVCVDYGENGYWISNKDPFQKQVKDKLIDSIVSDVNDRVFPIRKEIIEGITKDINGWKDKYNGLTKWFIISNSFWMILSIILGVIAATSFV